MRPLPSEEFVTVLEREARNFQYNAFATPRNVAEDYPFLVPPEAGLIRFLPVKEQWHYAEFMAFEGEEFAYAVARSLSRRLPTQGELYWAGSKKKPWSRIELMLQMDRKNRKNRSGAKLHGLGLCKVAWSLASRFEKKWRVKFLAKAARAVFKRLANRRVKANLADASLRRLVLTAVDKIDTLRKSRGKP